MDIYPFNLPEAVIFDLDGLLINTDKLLFQSLARLLSRYGRTLSTSKYGQVLGNSSTFFYQELFAKEIPALQESDFWREVNQGFLIKDIQLKPGALDLLLTLKQLSIPVAIATNSTRSTFLERTQNLAIYDLINKVITAEAVLYPKPDPEIYLKTAHSLGKDPKNCLILEDSIAGISAGYRSGGRVAFVPNPYIENPSAQLISYPVALFPSLEHVRAEIFKNAS